MTRARVTRALGGGILAVSLWLVLETYFDFAAVSPIHWGLLAPYASLNAVPVVVGAIAGGFMLLTGRGVRALLLALALTVIQAAAVAALTPDIQSMYRTAVRQSLDTLHWAPAGEAPANSSAEHLLQ